MALIQNTGQTSSGVSVPIPVGGLVASTSTPLAANAVYSTPILLYNGNESIHFSMAADQIGSYVVEYYKGATKLMLTPGSVVFDPSVVAVFQGALAGKGDGFKIIYTNGTVAQTAFYLEVRFGDAAQQTFRSFGTPAASTNMAGTTHAAIEGRNNGAGSYNQVTVTPSSAKFALDVNVVNPTTPLAVQPVSGSFFQATQPVSGTVTVSNLTSSIGATGGFTLITLAANVQQTIAANANRKQVIISSTVATVLVGVGFTATANNWSYKVLKDGALEIDPVAAPLSISFFSAAAATVNVTQVI